MLYINLHQKVSLFAMNFPLHCLDFDSSSQFFSCLALKSSFHLKGLCQGFEGFLKYLSNLYLQLYRSPVVCVKEIFIILLQNFILCLIELGLDITQICFVMSNRPASGKEFSFLCYTSRLLYQCSYLKVQFSMKITFQPVSVIFAYISCANTSVTDDLLETAQPPLSSLFLYILGI